MSTIVYSPTSTGTGRRLGHFIMDSSCQSCSPVPLISHVLQLCTYQQFRTHRLSVTPLYHIYRLLFVLLVSVTMKILLFLLGINFPHLCRFKTFDSKVVIAQSSSTLISSETDANAIYEKESTFPSTPSPIRQYYRLVVTSIWWLSDETSLTVVILRVVSRRRFMQTPDKRHGKVCNHYDQISRRALFASDPEPGVTLNFSPTYSYSFNDRPTQFPSTMKISRLLYFIHR